MDLYDHRNIIPANNAIKNLNDNPARDAEETDVPIAVTGKSNNSLALLVLESVELLSILYTTIPSFFIGTTICFVFGSTATVCDVMFSVCMD
ncbi:hypothetical protein DPV78_007297 [Talaromyces pinophilus]|nr:hypothetical protein DPV78_007297 [Talaromyces pinophilus]